MFSFLDGDGAMALRLSKELTDEFLFSYESEPVIQYGSVMRLGGSPGGSGGSTGGSGGCCSYLLESAGTPGSGGEGGWSYAIFDWDVGDGASPTLDSNVLHAGSPGNGAAFNGNPGQNGESNF